MKYKIILLPIVSVLLISILLNYNYIYLAKEYSVDYMVKISILLTLLISMIVGFISYIISKDISKQIKYANNKLDENPKSKTKELERSKKNLELEKKKLDEILSILPVPILITNNETKKIVFANNYASTQYRTTLDKLIGMSISDLYIDNSQSTVILKAIAKQTPLVNFETNFKLLDGQEIDALLSLTEIEYNNEPCHMGSISDITEIKEIQNKLNIDKDKAESSNKSKDGFLANMSHEIRTPLNAIIGFIELLQEDEKDKIKQNYLNIISSSSKSLLEIINDILDFSKIESGKLCIDKTDFFPLEEFKLTNQLFKTRLDEKNIKLYSNYNQLPLSLNGDILRIKQVLNNLLGNAIKFTPNDKNIFINMNYKENHLFVNVRDEGIGISEEYQNKIFDAFTQEDGTTTRKYGGTGLGLSISYSLIKIMGGEIKLKSKLGKGSEFDFSLPLKVGKKTTKEIDTQILKQLSGHILLVEDNKANQMFMKVILKKLNLTFDIASDGLEALEQFKLNNYDLIIMDENMPNMNGIEATKRILEIEKENNQQHTPIVALTANAIKGDKERFLNAGMDEYLTKPVDRIKLAEILENILATKESM
ncbi:MAG: hypothetical protein DRG78_11200 [Epsilonproteobacteria bacterium]|nr:MAG: hypothetical protein DRG78_11200 [Campylobacterota bacterium]